MGENSDPRIVLLFSGKRKSGKDYLTDRLQEILGEKSVIVRLSGPLKEAYAKDHGLDFAELLTAGAYKEEHRSAMLSWSEEIRRQDYTYFCRAAIEKYRANHFPIWIISDARRITDIQFFRENHGSRLVRIRIHAAEEVRRLRGWVFTPGVDDAETECGLDDYKDWNYRIDNSGEATADTSLEPILKHLSQHAC